MGTLIKSAKKKTKTKRKLLIEQADKYFALYIKYRDGQKFFNPDTSEDEWFTVCITCHEWKPLNKMQAGHFQSRRYFSTRWEDFNVNGQCARCNIFNHGEQYKYATEIDKKFGNGTAQTLARLAQTVKKYTDEDLQKIIDDAKEQIRMYQEEF